MHAGPKTAAAIVRHRSDKGRFETRSDLLKVKGIGSKNFLLAAGFVRVCGSQEILDATEVHPESYGVAKALLKLARLDDIASNVATAHETTIDGSRLDAAVQRVDSERDGAACPEPLRGCDSKTLRQVSQALQRAFTARVARNSFDPRFQNQLHAPVFKSQVRTQATNAAVRLLCATLRVLYPVARGWLTRDVACDVGGRR